MQTQNRQTVIDRVAQYPALAAAVLSAVLSLFALSIATYINTDGILYLRTAQMYIDSGVQATYDLYNHPFYPIVIGALSKYSGLGLSNSAHAINIILWMLLSYSFVRLIQLHTPSLSAAWIGAACLLLQPVLNSYREEIYRDFGYLAFCVFALTLPNPVFTGTAHSA